GTSESSPPEKTPESRTSPRPAASPERLVALPQRGTAFGSRVESDLPLPLGRSCERGVRKSLWVRRGRPERLYPSDRRLTRIGAGSEVTGVLSAMRGTVWVECAGEHPGALWAAVMGLSLPHLL